MKSAPLPDIMSVADFDLSLGVASADSVPGVGVDMKSLKELSVVRGAFHGNRRSDMHANIMASDQMSAG